MTARFSITIAGVLIEQMEDGSWWATEPLSAYGCTSIEEMREVIGCDPERRTLEDAGFAFTGGAIEQLIVGLVTMLPAYRSTIREVCGPEMVGISNQSWCPFADDHLPHVQCRECMR